MENFDKVGRLNGWVGEILTEIPDISNNYKEDEADKCHVTYYFIRSPVSARSINIKTPMFYFQS